LVDVDQINSNVSDRERNKGADSFMLEEEMAKINIMSGTQSLIPLPSSENKLDKSNMENEHERARYSNSVLSSGKQEKRNEMNSPDVSKISTIKGNSTHNGMNFNITNPITPMN